MSGSSENASGIPRALIRMFSLNYSPEPTGIGPYVADLAEYLAGHLGVKVEVRTAVPHYPRWQVYDEYLGRCSSSEDLNGVRVRRFPVVVPGGMTMARRVLLEVSYLVRAVPGALVRNQALAVGYVPGLSSGLVAVISGRRGLGSVIVVQDLVSRGISQAGTSGSRFLVRPVELAESWILRAASSVVAITDDFVPHLEAMGVERDRIQVLSNWSRPQSSPRAADVRRIRTELLAGGYRRLVLHTGSVGPKQGLDQVVEAARQAQIDSDGTRFCIVGRGSDRDSLSRQAAGLSNLCFLDECPPHEYGSLLAAADALLVSQASTNVDMSFPSKIGAYLLSGRPIIAWVPGDGAVARYFLSTEAAVVVPSGQIEELLSELRRVLMDYGTETYQLLGERALKAAKEWDANRLLAEWSAHILSDYDQSALSESAQVLAGTAAPGLKRRR